MKAKRRMTGAEFEALRPLLKISDDRVQAARLALVDGQTLQGVANLYGWSRQAVGDAVKVVWKTFERYHESQRAAASAGALMPPGWEQVTLIAPTALIAKFRAEIADSAPAAGEATSKKPAAKKAAAKTTKAKAK
jgi:hypothetical protein